MVSVSHSHPVTRVSLKCSTKTIKSVMKREQSDNMRNVFVRASTYGRTIALSSPNPNARVMPKTICEALPCSANINNPTGSRQPRAEIQGQVLRYSNITVMNEEVRAFKQRIGHVTCKSELADELDDLPEVPAWAVVPNHEVKSVPVSVPPRECLCWSPR